MALLVLELYPVFLRSTPRMSAGGEDGHAARADALPRSILETRTARCAASGVHGANDDQACPGDWPPRSRCEYPEVVSLLFDVPALKSSYRAAYVANDFKRVSHATKPGAGLPGKGRNDLGYRFAEFRDADRRTGPAHFFEDRQARRFEFGNGDLSHIHFVPWSMTMVKTRPLRHACVALPLERAMMAKWICGR